MTDSVQRSKQDWLLLVGLFCFFFSGAAGLIYQVVWTRMLTQIFGNTTYAIATVLSAFMAGLAIGSYCSARLPIAAKTISCSMASLKRASASTVFLCLGCLPARKNSTARSSA